MTHIDPRTVIKIPVPLQACARGSSRGEEDYPYEGVLRISGQLVLVTNEIFRDPQQAAHAAISQFVGLMRDLNVEQGNFSYEAETDSQD